MIALIAHDGETSYGIKQYALDTPEDLNKLPKCQMGSTAIVISTGEAYMINSQGEWCKL